MPSEPIKRFRSNLRKEAQAINERNRVPGDPYYKEKSPQPRTITTWIQFTVQINLKVPKFGPGYRRERHEFRFCAQSGADARSLASRNVPSRGFEKEVEIVEALPLFGEVHAS